MRKNLDIVGVAVTLVGSGLGLWMIRTFKEPDVRLGLGVIALIVGGIITIVIGAYLRTWYAFKDRSR